MIKEAIATGTTIEEAMSAALKELAAPEEADVKYDVLEQPKKKTLGLFGGSLAKVKASYEIPDDPFAKAKDYLQQILKSLCGDEAEISIDIQAEDEDVKINIDCGDDYGSVIGRRGETLDAIQYLTRLVINRGSEDYKRVSINIGNYREKRENTLRGLARKNAAKVRKYGRNVVLEPMNPYERRIIHTTVQEIEGVTSHSVGSDDDRKVVITLEEGVKPTNGYGKGRGGYNKGGKGGYNKGRGGYNKGGYNKGGYNKGGYNKNRSTSDQPVSARPPRSDSTGSSLYGKIEINK